ncbi:MAG: hypothetical protein HY541_04230 [Deltaproteobacteria bacterium]|nr:hypothetical protein [Deltaproteobacteria bacterium]
MAEDFSTSQPIQDSDLYLIDDQVCEDLPDDLPDDELLEESDSSSTDSFSILSDTWTSLQKTTASYADSAYKHATAVYTDAETYWNTHSLTEIASDTAYTALKLNPATAPAVIAYETATSPAVQQVAKYVIETPVEEMAVDAVEVASEYFPEETVALVSAYNYIADTDTTQMLVDAVSYAVEKYPEEVAAVQSLVASAKEILPQPIQKLLNSIEDSVIEAIGGDELVAWLRDEPQIPATEPIVPVATVKEIIETTPAPQSTSTPASAPVVVEEETASWSSGYDYSIADEGEEVVSTDAVVEEDIASPVVTAPVEETVVVTQTQTAQVEVKKEEAVVVTEETKSEEDESSKKAVAVQTTTKQADVTSVSEDERFAVSVEYAETSPLLSGVPLAAGQALSASESTRPENATLNPRQKINWPAAAGETIAVADQGKTSELNGVAEKVSIGRVSVEEKQEVEVAHAGAKTEKSASTGIPSLVATAGGPTDAERIAEFDARDGVQDAGFVPVPSAAAATVSRKDSAATDGELGAVASNLDSPLNDVPGSGDKGFDSNDEGRDRSVENIHALADAGEAVAEEEIVDADVIESSIFPSDVVV